MALSLEDMMTMSLSMEETMMISVQNTVGEKTWVRVRMSDPTGLFPRQVADQVGFNPRMASRLRFYLLGKEGREDEDAPLSQWRSVHFSGKTWREVFSGNGASDALLLYMEMEDDTEQERSDKLRLLRTLLRQKGEADQEGDTVLWGEYLQWFVYAKGVSEMNRYETLLAFVNQRYDGRQMMVM